MTAGLSRMIVRSSKEKAFYGKDKLTLGPMICY